MEKIKQINNFVVYHEELESGYKQFIIKSVAGSWELKFRNDNSQYHLIEAFIYDDEKDSVIENAFAVWFITTNAILDEAFFEDIMESTNSLMERLYGKFDDKEHQDEAGDLFVEETIDTVENGQL